VLGLVPAAHPSMVVMEGIRWNYTTILNIVALVVFAALCWLYRNRQRLGGGSGYAKDPVCGMQVEKAVAPATARRDDETLYFCSDHCQRRFLAELGGRAPAHPAEPGKLNQESSRPGNPPR
jgi:YHS domain-containing protein